MLEKLLDYQKRGIELAIAYYRNQAAPPFSSHPLKRLLYALHFPRGATDEQLFEQFTDVRYRLARVGNISSPVNLQDPIPGLIYNQCMNYLVTDNRMTIADVLSYERYEWKRLTPLKVLYHPYRYLNSHYPKGGGEGGPLYCVIGVDIPQLVIMARGWMDENARRPAGEQEGYGHFLSRYVIANLLYSQSNVTLLNIMAHAIGLDRPNFYLSKRTVYIPSFEKKIEEYMLKFLLSIDTRSYQPDDVLSLIPNATGTGSLYDERPLIHDIETQYVYHLRFMASLPYMETAISWVADSLYLRKVQVQLQRIDRHIQSYDIYTRCRDPEVADTLRAMYVRIKDIVLQ